MEELKAAGLNTEVVNRIKTEAERIARETAEAEQLSLKAKVEELFRSIKPEVYEKIISGLNDLAGRKDWKLFSIEELRKFKKPAEFY